MQREKLIMEKSKIKLYHSVSDRILLACIWVLLISIMIVFLGPILFILASSFSDAKAVSAGKVFLWPTIVGTIISVTLTLLAGYPLARKDLQIRGPVMFMFTITMFISGGMIPTYLVVNKLNLIDTFWAMVIPSAMGVWNVVLIKTYIQSSIPGEIFESACVDGCSDWKYFTKMVIPLSKPIIAVMVVLYDVGKWNDFMSGLLYINDVTKQPLQLILRNILIVGDTGNMKMTLDEQMHRQELKTLMQYSLIVVSSLPVMILYPFIQKHFVKGIMMGSIKG